MSNGTQIDVTATATWVSASPSIASVSSSGVLSGVATGQANVTATAAGASGSLTVAVAPVLKSLAIAGPASLFPGHTQQLSALGTYNDGSTRDLTSTVVWSSSNLSVATVSATGLITGVATGQTTIGATTGGVAATQTETVNPNTLNSLSVSPQNLTMYAGTAQQFQALGVYADGTTADVSSTVSWTSSNTADASVSAKGSVEAIAAGSATINASIGSVKAGAPVQVNAATSGFTYVNDLTDSRLLSYQVGGGAKVDFFGSRTSTGDPSAITGFRSTAADGSWQQYALDSQGRPVQVGVSDGSLFGFTWTGASNGTLTGVSADRSAAESVAIGVTSSGTTLQPQIRTSVGPKALSTPGQSSPTTETVRVTSCNGKNVEDGAMVTVAHVAAFGGDPVPAAWAGPGTGTFYADIGSGPVNLSSTALAAAKNAFSATCDFLSDGQPLGNPALALSPATCVAFSEVPALAASCAVAGYGLTLLDDACKAQSIWSGFNSVIDYVDGHQPLVSVNVTATLNGQSLQKTLTSVPQAGPVPGVAIDFPCVAVDHVTVSPATATVPVKGTKTLTALPFDSANKVLQSSGFTWSWKSDATAVANVVPGSTSSTNGFLLPFGVVTGVSGGTAPITATETSSSKSGSASVSVSTINIATREFRIIPFAVNTDVTINGVDLGIQNDNVGGEIVINVCSVPDGAKASIAATTKSIVYPELVANGFDQTGPTVSSAFSITGTYVALTCDPSGPCLSNYSNYPSQACVTIPGLSQ